MGRHVWELGRISAPRWDRIALIAVIAGAVIRAAWVLSLHPPLDYVYSDMGGYVDRAVKLALAHPLDRYDAFYPPGTHWLLALPLAIFGTDRTGLWAGAVLWWAMSALTPLAMWRFGRYHLTIPAAALTAVFVSFWPIQIAYSGYFLSETPSLALLVASLWLTSRAAVSTRAADPTAVTRRRPLA
ncbi:MAG TPA: glycosyltransferase family 39 protein, partial [Candidatus Limnocylindrales bacterium]|nr:glycosyltransferase family 39 protein [Candidatus Limnocylindrales bacterium]